MKKLIPLLMILLSVGLANAQELDLPLLGKITIAGGFVSIVLFIIGYFIGSSIKSGLKYALVFFAFIIILVFMGFVGSDVLKKITEVVVGLKPLYEKYLNVENVIGTLSLPIMAFVTGCLFGWFRG